MPTPIIPAANTRMMKRLRSENSKMPLSMSLVAAEFLLEQHRFQVEAARDYDQIALGHPRAHLDLLLRTISQGEISNRVGSGALFDKRDILAGDLLDGASGNEHGFARLGRMERESDGSEHPGTQPRIFIRDLHSRGGGARGLVNHIV